MKRRLIVTAVYCLMAVGLLSSSIHGQSTSAANSSTAAAAPISPDLTVTPGEKLVVQLDTPLHTRSTRDGDRAYFKTSDEVMAGGIVAIPRGSEVRATVTEVRQTWPVGGPG